MLRYETENSRWEWVGGYETRGIPKGAGISMEPCEETLVD